MCCFRRLHVVDTRAPSAVAAAALTQAQLRERSCQGVEARVLLASLEVGDVAIHDVVRLWGEVSIEGVDRGCRSQKHKSEGGQEGRVCK